MNVKRMAMVVGCVTAVTLLLLYHTRVRKRWKRRMLDSKPQRNFKLVLADNSYRPFIHLRPPQITEHWHPFHEDISTLLERSYNPHRIAVAKECPPPMTDDFIWVDTKDGLEMAVGILSKESEFSVDTEQHSIRSFYGFTALLQVSTRNQDFLIDAIALHDEMSLLRKVFSDPNICKVFHGADSDILWLQRDFHIYVVNLFDTAKACDILGKRSRSLAFLLEHYCGIATNKIFQLADWRLRPLPEEMLLYARIDAHYLLYIADCLQKELLQGENMGKEAKYSISMYDECARRSNLMCLQLYEKDVTLPATIAASLLSRYNDGRQNFTDSKEHCDSRAQKALIALCGWRNNIARFSDESPRYVLSDQAILAIVEKHPTTKSGLLECLTEGSDAPQALDEVPYMTHIPSPSPILLKNIDSLMEVLDDVENGASQGYRDFQSLKITEYSKASGDQFRRQTQQHDPMNKIPRDCKTHRRKFVERFSCKGPVYENCRIYASDGGLLCFCDRKKLDWYVQRRLAELLDEDPPAIKLLFEPKRRSEDEKTDFYLQSKINRCVGCGETSHYLRYRVVPSCYRQYFPQHLKSHRSHDIVLLCVDCHVIANSAAEKHKRKVASKFGVPLFAQRMDDDGLIMRNESEAVGLAAVALLRYGSKIPEGRRKELEAVVQAYYGGKSISQQDITEAALFGRRKKELSRRQRKKSLAATDKVLSTRVTEDSGANLYCNGMEVASRSDLSDEKAVLKNVRGKVLSSDNSPCNALMGIEIVVNKGTAAGELDGVKFDVADLSSRVGNAGSCEDLRGIILDNVKEVGSEEISSKLEPSNGVEIDDIHTRAEELSDERKQQEIFLQGHTFHGKKVVEMLLEREGEEGITKFCQMWRTVFVEAVNPTHLPSGWNILHSDYREFGEHSIFYSGKEL